jgi:hypothetical protein
MKRLVGLLTLAGVLSGLLSGCGATPEPTQPPPTQTPWIIVVTATPGPDQLAQVQPTQTPWIIVATPTPSRTQQGTATASEPAIPDAEEIEPSPSATAKPAQTPEPPRPTNTTELLDIKYEAPVLLDPPDNMPVSWNSRLTLLWSSVGNLAADEYYVVKLERRPKLETEKWWSGELWVKETGAALEGAFLDAFHLPEAEGQAIVRWWVRVARKTGEDASGKPIGIDLSGLSDEWTLILEPKPEGN